MRRAALVTTAVALAAAGLALVALALDVRRAERALADGDVRFAAAPRVPAEWTGSELVPFGTARRLLGLDDDVAFRRAVQLFWRGRPREQVGADPHVASLRAGAVAALWDVAQRDPDPRRRAEATNLLGVLALVSENSPEQYVYLVRSAAESFRRATLLDPASDESKHNLELVLQNSAPKESSGDGGQGGREGRRGEKEGGAAASQAGSGY